MATAIENRNGAVALQAKGKKILGYSIVFLSCVITSLILVHVRKPSAIFFPAIGFALFFISGGLNALVQKLNGGKMPVNFKALELVMDDRELAEQKQRVMQNPGYCVMSPETRLKFLGDTIPLTGRHPFSRGAGAQSIGDLLGTLSLVIVLVSLTLSIVELIRFAH